MSNRLRVVSGGFLVCLAALTSEARASTINPVISGSQSTLNASMTFNGATATTQSTGSLSDAYSGAITGDLTNNVLTFTGGSSIVADGAQTAYQPPVGGANTAGTVQNYGGFFSNISVLSFSFSSDADLRGLNLSITGGSAAVGGPANGLSFTLEGGDANYSVMNLQALGVPNGYYSDSLGGLVATNASTSPVTLSQNGSTETLTIPVNLTFSFSEEGLPATINLTGNLVSTYAVPEPSELALLAGAAGALLALGFARRACWRGFPRKVE